MITCTIIAAAAALSASAAHGLVSDAEADARAAAVLKTLTLEEKVSLLSGAGTMFLNAIPEKGIAREWTFSDNSNSIRADMTRFDWVYSHKDANDDSSTVLPLPSALASTWNRDLAALHGDILGSEMLVRGKDQLLGPGVNLMRTPLCGRNWEYMGEDPCLASKLVVPLIKALQSHGVAATIKHFAANEQELCRYTVDTDIDERTLREIYLRPFEAAVREAGVLSVMSSYNKFRGRWAGENDYLLTDVLRHDWGFKGMCVTDWGGQHSTVRGALAGQDVECNQGYGIRHYQNPWLCWQKYKTTPLRHSDRETQPLAYAVKDGLVPEDVVDRMATHVLWTMAKCRFFDQPSNRVARACNPPEHQKGARMIGEEAVTLLRNSKKVLPLDAKSVKTLLVVGNLVDAHHTVGGWSAEGNPPYEITVYEALRERLGDGVRIVKAPLVATDAYAGVHGVAEKLVETTDDKARDTGMTIRGWKTKFWNNRQMEGEPVADGFTRELKVNWHADAPAEGCVAGRYSVRWNARIVAPESGEFVLATKSRQSSATRVKVDGGMVVDNWDGRSSALATGRVALEKDRSYEFEVDYMTGDSESAFEFGWLYPSEAGMRPEEIKAAALAADAVLVFTGTTVGHGRAMECEGADRPSMKLPAGHDEAISAILGWGVGKLVVVNHSGSPVEMPWIAGCDTLVQEPYMGQEGGRPLVSVLFGDVNPSGRLPCTWPVRYEDTAVATMGEDAYGDKYSNYSERFHYGYRWHDLKGIAPMFPFGYGLGYSTFRYGAPSVSSAATGWRIVVPLENTGSVDGKEVVQLYVSSPDSKVERCVKDLRDFAKVSVKAGGTATAELSITPRDLAYWDVEGHCFRADRGRYELLVGASAADIRGKVWIELSEDWKEVR